MGIIYDKAYKLRVIAGGPINEDEDCHWCTKAVIPMDEWVVMTTNYKEPDGARTIWIVCVNCYEKAVSGNLAAHHKMQIKANRKPKELNISGESYE